MATYNFAAIDLGATSGRVILATINNGTLGVEEIHRFPTPLIQMQGHYYWDFAALYHSIIEGLKKVGDAGVKVTSIGIDTWGVDVARFGDDGALLRLPYAYRDPDRKSVV